MRNVSAWTRGLRLKLVLSSLVPISAFALMIGISVYSMVESERHLTVAYSEIIPQNNVIKDMHAQRMSLSYFLWAAYSAKDQESFADFIQKAKNSREALLKAVNEFEASSTNADQKDAWKEFAPHKDTYFNTANHLISLLEEKDPVSMEQFYKLSVGGEFHKLGIKLRKSSQKVAEISVATQDQAHQQQEEATRKIAHVVWSVGLGASICMVFLLGVMASRIAGQIHGVTHGLSDSEVNVSQAVHQLGETGQLLANSASSAAASLEETVASMTEIQSLGDVSSKNAQNVAQVSAQSQEKAEKAKQIMTNLLLSIKSISEASKKIESIISVIDDIAFQTNLLALNAAVEAARAGDHGKGFAVVAAAVRDLALKSSTSAKEIGELIKDSVHKVEQGSAHALDSEKSLQELQEVLQDIVRLSNDVAEATRQQAAGIGLVNKALIVLDNSTQSNAASSEEIAASIQQISHQMNTLGASVGTLSHIVNGEKLAS